LRPRDPRRPDGSLTSPAPRACLTANAVAPTSRRSRRLAQAMKYWLLLQSRRPRSLACGSAWKHAPAPHARRSRTPSRTALLFSQSASVRTCPTLSLCSLVPSPKSSRPRQTPPDAREQRKGGAGATTVPAARVRPIREQGNGIVGVSFAPDLLVRSSGLSAVVVSDVVECGFDRGARLGHGPDRERVSVEVVAGGGAFFGPFAAGDVFGDEPEVGAGLCEPSGSRLPRRCRGSRRVLPTSPRCALPRS
jgi:hypothetical protein